MNAKNGEASKYVCTLDTKTVTFMEEYLHETEESRQKGLEEITQWANENPHLHVNTEEFNLLAFLRGTKFDVERAKAKLTSYYKMRRDVPEWFRNRNPLLSEMQELIRLGCFVPLRRTFDGQMVVVIRTAVHDPYRHLQDDVFKADMMILDIACREMEAAAQIYGVTAIFDVNGGTLAHARLMTPAIIRKAVYSWQNYHCKPKRLEFVNAPLYVNVLVSVFKSFMPEKLMGRVRVHYKGSKSLQHVIPLDILPKEYGGHGEDLQETIQFWYRKIQDYTDWFAYDEQFRAD